MGKPPSPSRSQSRFESNVFARLTSNLVQSENTGVEFQYKGHFRRSDSRTRNAGGPLVCSHIAEGHKGEVLSVCATDHLLFSASKGESGLSQQAALSWEIQLIKLMTFVCVPSVCTAVHIPQFGCVLWNNCRASLQGSDLLPVSSLPSSSPPPALPRRPSSSCSRPHCKDMGPLCHDRGGSAG